jgi:hypothetical protein
MARPSSWPSPHRESAREADQEGRSAAPDDGNENLL